MRVRYETKAMNIKADKKAKLEEVIGIDSEKCINCYACITACPVKYCMNGSGDKLVVDHDLCIGCGNCIPACHHNARLPIDDTQQFLTDLRAKSKMIAIVAPAAAAVFPGNLLRLNGYLLSLGIKAVFDVSFGAELTVLSYINHIKEKQPKMMIAQPCPAIVNFIEIYHPGLLPHLAPIHSPMLHSVKMIQEYFPEYRNYKIAAISPCLAKKREFSETGLVDYNVTMLALKNLIAREGIDLKSYPAAAYTGLAAERAVSFSSPGGLLDTAERFSPGIRRRTRKIEGVHTVFPYLAGVEAALDKPGIEFPLLIDCLNCEMGCNGGPGTGNHDKSMDELESPVRKRSAELEKNLNPKQQERLYKKYNKLLTKYWKPGLYERQYRNISENSAMRRPSENELAEAYKALKKFTKDDLYDCTACGYGSCKSMATAIFNNLNKASNCAHYNLELLEEGKKTTLYINRQYTKNITGVIALVEEIKALVEKLDAEINTQSKSVADSSAIAGEIVDSIKSTSEFSLEERKNIQLLMENTAKGQGAMRETSGAVQNISQSVDGISSAIKIISVIASNTNLLAMNAAIEAAHAGDAGSGFAVVADEIRRLSISTRDNSRNIAQTLSSIIEGINTTSKRTSEAGSIINEMATEINDVAGTITKLIDTLNELSAKSSGVISSLDGLKEHSAAVATDYDNLRRLTKNIHSSIACLSAMSSDFTKALEENNHEMISRLNAELTER